MRTSIEELLSHAVAEGASDVHLKVGSPPVIRVGGQLTRIGEIPPLDQSDTAFYADALFTEAAAVEFKTHGTADFAYGRPELGRFRISAFHQRGSVSLIMRRVVPGSKSFAELGLPPAVERAAKAESGLLLVTGPTGSGKTSTMASIIDWINTNRSASIVTIEDPIEVLHPDKQSVVVQREIGVDTPNFVEAVRGAIRHDSDVIMISEMDDIDTVRAAISAAETGHLVVSSMRTSDAGDTLNRLISLFPETQQSIVRGQLAAQLVAVCSQRLLDSAQEGKVLAVEVLGNNERVADWLRNPAPVAQLYEVIKESEFFGMQTFDQALLKLVVAGDVELPVAMPHARNVHELRAKAMAAGIQI